MGLKIAELPLEERPREKALKAGIESLSDEEVLALVLSRGVKGSSALDVSRGLLARFGGFAALGSASAVSLEEVKGIKEAKALEIIAVFEIAKRYYKSEPMNASMSAQGLYQRYRLSLQDEVGEKGLLLLYDRRGRFLKEKLLFSGNEDTLSSSPKLLISEALSSKASSFVFLHNHPSGNPSPSSSDISFTSSLEKKSGDMGLRFLDHIIVAADRFYSFRDNGFL